jgi:hypothetical protein
VPPVAFGPMMAVRRRAAVVLRRRLPVEQGTLDIHAQLGHLFKSRGSDEVLPVPFGRVFHDPLQLLCGIDEDTPNGKRIHWSQTFFVFGLGFH